MKKFNLFIIAIVIFSGCTEKLKTRELGAYAYKTKCVSSFNGNLLVVAWGRGLTKTECETNALKSAIFDVVFKGLGEGSPTCTQPPILTAPNAEAKYQNFMSNFLAETGNYKAYAALYDEPNSQHYRQKVRKLDKVENMALEFQIKIDRVGLVKLFQQTDLLK